MGWKNLPNAVRQLVKTSNPHGTIRIVALGVKESYVVLYNNGQMQWDLKGAYDRLDGYLDNVSPGQVLYASLSPYQDDRFFAAFADSSVLYSFDQSWAILDKAFLDCNDLGVIIDSGTLKHTSPIVMQKKSRFGADFVKSALSGAIEGLANEAVTSD